MPIPQKRKHLSLLLILLSILLSCSIVMQSKGYSWAIEELLSAQNHLPNVHPVFNPILADLSRQVQIPIQLPHYLPNDNILTNTDTDKESLAHATLEEVTSSSYLIEIGIGEDCNGSGFCHLGFVFATKVTEERSALEGEPVPLARGITGYFIASECGANCSDATLSWEQNGVQYTIGDKAGSLDELTKSANSAIENELQQ